MERTLDTAEYLGMVVSLLREGQRNVPVPVSGTSMAPFLHPGDTVYLNLPHGKLRKGDIVLYTRPGGRYVLHRIVGRRSDGILLLLGDGQMAKEPVASERVCDVATAARKDGKSIDSRSLIWWFFRGPWRIFARWRPWIGKIARSFRKWL